MKKLTKTSRPALKPHSLMEESSNTTEDCNRSGSMVMLLNVQDIMGHMGNQEEAPNSFERNQGKALRILQGPYSQCKFSLNGVVDRYLDTNDIYSFHMSRGSKKSYTSSVVLALVTEKILANSPSSWPEELVLGCSGM